MESSVEQRLTFLEARVKTLEGLLAVARCARTGVRRAAAFPSPRRHCGRGPDRDGVRLSRSLHSTSRRSSAAAFLGWVGGIAVAIAAIFFVVMAVRNGWIGEAARMELAFAASAALVGFRHLALRAPRPDAGRARDGRGRHRCALREHGGDDAALPPPVAGARTRDRRRRRRARARHGRALELPGDRRDRDRRLAAGAGVRRLRNEHELARVHDDRAPHGDRRRRPPPLGLARRGRVRRQRSAGGELALCGARPAALADARSRDGVLAALRRGRARLRAAGRRPSRCASRLRRCSSSTPRSQLPESGG